MQEEGEHFKKQVNPDSQSRRYSAGKDRCRRISNESGRQNHFVGKKFRRKFVTDSDDFPTTSDELISDGLRTNDVVGMQSSVICRWFPTNKS